MMHATVARGPCRGKLLFPHRHADGKLVVSKDRFKRNYIRVDTLDEAERYVREGLCLRMSNPSEGIMASSLIHPSSIRI